MADIIFPDIAGVDSAIARQQALRQATAHNALRDRLLGLQINQAQDAYSRDVEGRALFPKAIGGDAAAANQLAGVNPELYGRLVEIKKNARAEQWDLMSKRATFAGQTGAAVLALPMEQRPQAWAAARQRLIGSGLFQPNEIPAQYDDTWVSMKAREAQSVDAIMKSLDEQPRLQMPGGGLVPANQYRPPQAAPAAPAPAQPPVRAAGPSAFGPGLTGGVIERIVGAESGGNPNARNPRSSATGAGQFINSTWLSTIKDARPDLAGRSDAELLAMRSDPALSRQMVMAYAGQNARVLSDAGLPVTPGTVYLAHFAGPGGARAVLSANPNTPVAQILGPKVVSANPFLVNMTAGQLAAWADQKMAGSETSPQRMADVPGMVAPANTAALPPEAFSPSAMGAPPAPPQFTTSAPQPAPAPAPAPQQGLIPLVDRKGLPLKMEGVPQGMRPMFNPATGQVEVAPIPGAPDVDKTPEGQFNAALYGQRMANAEKVIQRFEKEGTAFLPRAITGATFPFTNQTVVPGMLANKMLQEGFQQLRQAERDFINAVLRRESGAVISDQEFSNASQQYFPQPGDTEAVIRQKREARRIAIEGITRASGNVLKGNTAHPSGTSTAPVRVNTPEEARRLPSGTPITLPDGSTGRVP